MNSGSFNWVQLVGYLASLLVFSTFYMKTMIPLRCIAIASNLAFLTYGYFAGLYPVFFLHLVLLPLNVTRLHQMRKLKERVRQALDQDFSLEWMLPFVKRESFKEVDRTIHAGEIIGEIGVFSPFKERTASAVCATDSTFLVLSESTALELYYQNPDFGLCMLRTIIRRFLDQQPQGAGDESRPDPEHAVTLETPKVEVGGVVEAR